MQGRIFKDLRNPSRHVRVLWVYPDAAVGDVAVCDVLQGGVRKRTKIQVRRLNEPSLFVRMVCLHAS